ncbi:uncharacterized protein LOC126831537 isoform X2 [Patella vulgata]|nr:uncharacterized protein LOC126831537 isoform X2 [Patella vulgata]
MKTLLIIAVTCAHVLYALPPTKQSTALTSFLTKINFARNTDTVSNLAATPKNEARHFNPSYPYNSNPYLHNPYSNAYPNPYAYNPYNAAGTGTGTYNPFNTAGTGAYTSTAINPYNPPKYYKDPQGKLYNVLSNGSLYDPVTLRTYPPGPNGERTIPNTSGTGGSYTVTPDGSTYTTLNGIRYRVDSPAADGNRYYTDASGNKFFIDSSGTRIYVLPSGVQYYTDPTSGTTYYKDLDGTVYYTGSNGVTYYKNPTNGDVYIKDAFGNIYGTTPSGLSYITTANGCSYSVSGTGATTLTTTSNVNYCPATFTGSSPDGTTFTG